MSRTAADLLLLLVALVWGGSFVVVRDSLRQIPPFLLIGGRFALAFTALGLIFPRRLRAWRGHLGAGLLLALPLLGGFALQTLGLRYTTASASGFLTGLNVIFVALIIAAGQGGRLDPRSASGAALAGLGVTSLCWRPGGFSLGPGELLTLICAVCFAAHIVLTGRLAPGRDPVVLAAVQFAAVAACGLVLHLLLEGGGFASALRAGWPALLYLGLAATGFAFLVQTAAQRHTPPVDTAVVLTTEPLFAAIIAVALGGEQVTARMVLGGGMIFAAMLLVVISPAKPGGKEGTHPRGPLIWRGRVKVKIWDKMQNITTFNWWPSGGMGITTVFILIFAGFTARLEGEWGAVSVSQRAFGNCLSTGGWGESPPLRQSIHAGPPTYGPEF